MKKMRVLLVDNTAVYQKLLSKRLQNPDSIRFVVTLTSPKSAETVFRDAVGIIDIIVLGNSLSNPAILQLTKFFRSCNPAVPIFVLTEKNEVRLPLSYKKAGIDDLLKISEMGTSLFAWSFISTVEQVVLKKKAKEYDTLHNQLRNVSSSLATFVHEINNPLSVIRLALYHLENRELSKQKRETFFQLLLNNLERIEGQMRDISVIRRQLNGVPNIRAKVLTLKSSQRSAVIR